MPLRPLASLAAKIIGLFIALNTLPSLMLVVLPFTSPYVAAPAWIAALVNAVSGSLQIGVGIALWWFSDGVAELLVRNDDGKVRNPWTELGFALLGLYFAVDAVAHLVQVAGVLLLMNYPPNVATMPPDNLNVVLREAIPQVVRGVIGLGILLGAKGLVRGVLNLKNMGRDAEELP